MVYDSRSQRRRSGASFDAPNAESAAAAGDRRMRPLTGSSYSSPPSFVDVIPSTDLVLLVAAILRWCDTLVIPSIDLALRATTDATDVQGYRC